MESLFEVEGKVEQIVNYYTTKAGKTVRGVRLDNGEIYVDWKERARDVNVGQKVGIVYRDWTPSKIQLPKHHVIEKIVSQNDLRQNLQVLVQKLEEAVSEAKRIMERL
jgi:hypothetical protein